MEIISSRKNGNVRMMRELLGSAEYRRETGMFAVEGDHLCGELADCRGIEYFLYTEKAAEKYPETVGKVLEKAAFSAVITEELSEYISDTKSPQGLFIASERFWIKIPENARRAVVLDGVQDPGNVGTIIRAAEAFGTDAVILRNCADAFSPKTLRASMGSVFRVPVLPSGIGELRECLGGFTVFGAMLDDTAKRLGEVKFPEKTAIIIGSEGGGISPEAAELCDEKIYIPIKGAQSLNAAMAAAVLLWELRK
ncbi:MAG: RNA methyltransferase [Lachnospiraceae bacterium]|nr:RNA methyltransferase [Ruminococcus sp.]MCM1274637.1 RNA methyltransferase [Lachnospiraceae bacterium]